MRTNLKQARLDKGMTQQQVADYLDIGVRYYQKIESGDRTGNIRLWDDLEDLFSIHQRMLRQTDQADSR
jgi:transcriptional regulator with XRE-family HTH domain